MFSHFAKCSLQCFSPEFGHFRSAITTARSSRFPRAEKRPGGLLAIFRERESRERKRGEREWGRDGGGERRWGETRERRERAWHKERYKTRETRDGRKREGRTNLLLPNLLFLLVSTNPLSSFNAFLFGEFASLMIFLLSCWGGLNFKESALQPISSIGATKFYCRRRKKRGSNRLSLSLSLSLFSLSLFFS